MLFRTVKWLKCPPYLETDVPPSQFNTIRITLLLANSPEKSHTFIHPFNLNNSSSNSRSIQQCVKYTVHFAIISHFPGLVLLDCHSIYYRKFHFQWIVGERNKIKTKFAKIKKNLLSMNKQNFARISITIRIFNIFMI